MKKCSKCGEEKELSEFYRAGNSEDGYRYSCKNCDGESSRSYREANRGKAREATRKWREKNRFVSVLAASRSDAKYRDHVPCNATPEELAAAFTGRCDICGCSEMECTTRLAMDHDHLTGNFRGFLCSKHNRMLGFAGDSEDVLIEALHYLMNPRKQKIEKDNDEAM